MADIAVGLADTTPPLPPERDIRDELRDELERTARELREAGVPEETCSVFIQMGARVYEPCVVAVVGRVKAGKSTFLNALLEQDLARAGVTETTAAIHKFTYGPPDLKSRVRIHYRDTDIVRDADDTLLETLTGASDEARDAVRRIRFIEYRLDNDKLRAVTLVDTPGTDAAVEWHREAIDEFMGGGVRYPVLGVGGESQLPSQHPTPNTQHHSPDFYADNPDLAARAYAESRQWGSEADALIYLFGYTPRTVDSRFLRDATASLPRDATAANTIGIIGKIDENEEALAQRHDLCSRILQRLETQVNIVLPVSATLKRFLDQISEPRLAVLIAALNRIPADHREHLLRSPDFWTGRDPLTGEVGSDESSGIPAETAGLSARERNDLLANLPGPKPFPWATFKTIARAAWHPEADEARVRRELTETAGFEIVTEVLRRRFFERGYLWRTYRVVRTALDRLRELETVERAALRQTDAEEEARMRRFLSYVESADGDPTTRNELRAYLEERLNATGRAERVAMAVEEAALRLDRLRLRLEEHRYDLDGISALDAEKVENPEVFSDDEAMELYRVFGVHGRDLNQRLPEPTRRTRDYARERQRYWNQRHEAADPGERRYRLVAECAQLRYGRLKGKLP
jgi:hypothetical protein